MYLQKVRKSQLSAFDEKRCYVNNIESLAWGVRYRKVARAFNEYDFQELSSDVLHSRFFQKAEVIHRHQWEKCSLSCS